ncbi:PH domain-containing protein [Ilumatobacter sp.]|uniref:PH domain-containing protein n=1 Tax=Ilumatobacter sp. TaxID=1967498 RepID=UPI003751FCDD
MPYPKKLLNDYETVAVDLHPHWWYFAEPVAALVGSIVLGILAIVSDVSGTFGDILKWLVAILIVVSAIWVVVRYLKWITTNFVITSDRLIFRAGVIAKMGVEIPLERVNTVHFSQSIFERMTGSGDLLIESGGEDGQQSFSDIRRPDRVQNLMHSQMEENEKRRFTVNTGGSTSDVATQLEKLEGMLERGTLSPEEFQSQKDKLLGS